MATDPDNKNFLSPLGFQFSIQRLPHVNYFCTSATIPSMTLGQIDDITNTFIKLPTPGDKLRYDELTLRFRVDEEMKNYKEIYDWMESIGFPDNFDQRRRVGLTNYDFGTVFSDSSLIVTTSSYKPNIEVQFIDMYPVSLSSVEFNIEQNDIEYLQADVSFVYRKYNLLNIEK